MKKILKYIMPYKVMALVILCLLGVQAFCDLSLPQYTSDMIDTGIQNHGVSYILPEKLTASEMELAQLFMNEQEISDWKSCYKKDGDLFVRTTNDVDRLDKLNDSLMIPLVLTYQSASTTEERFRAMMKQQTAQDPRFADVDMNSMSVEEIGKMFGVELTAVDGKDSDGNPAKLVDMRPMMLKMKQNASSSDPFTAMREQMEKTADTIGSSTLRSMGISYAISCDKAAGVDVDKIQSRYLWKQAFKMLLMSLMMLGASVGAGFLSARVGAGIGRDLRKKIFTRVIGYSNTEMDKFSTASLITRSTNDVQQVQMVSTMLLVMLLGN